MSELRLFSVIGPRVQEFHPASFKLEREIQNLFEANLEALLGVRLVASEFPTGHGPYKEIEREAVERHYPKEIWKLEEEVQAGIRGLETML